MPRIGSLILVVCALASTTAWGQFRVIEQTEDSYELSLRHVISFPSSTAGTVIFRECAECLSRALRVTIDTRYVVDDTELEFSDFERAITEIRATGGPTFVGVYYDIDTQNVSRIRVTQLRR